MPALTPRQVEFAEIFEQLQRDFKVTKAAVARALRIERSYVTMLLNGQRTPRIRTLEAMREFATRLTAGTQNDPAEDDLNQLFQQLKTMRQKNPQQFLFVKQVVASLASASPQLDTAQSRTQQQQIPAQIN